MIISISSTYQLLQKYDSNEQDELRIINNKGDNIHIKYLIKDNKR